MNLAAAAAKGAARMDEHDANWWKAIDTATLDIADYTACITAQYFGDFNEGTGLLFNDDPDVSAELSVVIEYGFDVRNYSDYIEINAAWLEEIEKRAMA